MPSISHCRPQDRQQLQQGKTFPSPSLEILQPELDRHPPGEGNASRALGQRGVPDDFGNVTRALFAADIHMQHFTTAALTAQDSCLLDNEITVTTVTTAICFSKG